MAGPENLAELLFPARDERFDTLVRALSEPATGPRGDNLTSNEDSYPRVAGAIGRQVPRGGVYLGVGPDQNFTMVAHARPRLSFVVDYRRRNLLLHLLHKALFSLAADRVAYLSRLTARDPGPLPRDPAPAELAAAFRAAVFDRRRLERTTTEVAAVLGSLGVLDDSEWAELATIHARLAAPGMNARFLALPMYPTLGRLIETTDRDGSAAHFLARDDLYHEVRTRQLGDRVVPLVGDFGQPRGLAKLEQWLRTHSLALSVLYISDVEFFLIRSGRFAAYVENLAALPWMKGALIVRSSTREIAHPKRMPDDSATTVVDSAAAFLAASRAGRVRTIDDLFATDRPPR